MRVAGAITIAGTALWLPDEVYSASEAQTAGSVTAADSEGELIGRLPVADIAPPRMARLAAQRALEHAGVTAAEVGLLVHAWVFDQGPQTWTPPHRVARELGARRCAAIGIRQMSNGGAAAMQTAIAHLLAEPRAASALVTTADNFSSLPYDRWLSVPPLGDGATAVVLTRGPGPQVVESITTAGDAGMELHFPTSDPFEPGAARTAGSPSRQALHAFAAHVRDAAEQALEDAGLDWNDISSVLLPRLGKTLVSHLARTGLPAGVADRVVRTGYATGHLGSGDMLANLAEHPGPRKDEHHLHVSTGAGLTTTCLITRGR
ncbi:ketoacyl-ACP synthase III family protein [Lentzea chajnantorensis]